MLHVGFGAVGAVCGSAVQARFLHSSSARGAVLAQGKKAVAAFGATIASVFADFEIDG